MLFSNELQPAKSTCNLSALLVEDAPENQFLMSKILERRAIYVAIANNGEEGVEMALSGHYDFILMDMHLPVLDGYEATLWLRGVGYDKPIIALTADSMDEAHRRILACGCDAHLTKPVDFARLLQTIGELTPQAGGASRKQRSQEARRMPHS